MVQFKNVTKTLEDFTLNDISLELPKGYIMGLVGPNGAGKTTLLYLIMGLYHPDSGQVSMNGTDATEEEIRVKNEIGYVLAEELFCNSLTLKENADMYGKYYNKYHPEIFLRYCEQFHLDSKRKLKQHSKGEKLKFQFAFALSHEAKLLLLDEPTANFDPEFREEFLKVITQFVMDGEHSVILATHLTKDLDRIADYVTLLHRGELIFSEDRETMENSYRLISGEAYKLNLLPKDKVIYQENGAFISKALVKHSQRNIYDKELQVEIPTIEDIMYYICKGNS